MKDSMREGRAKSEHNASYRACATSVFIDSHFERQAMEAQVTKRVKDEKDTGQTGNEVRKGCALARCANHNKLLLPPSSRTKVETSSHDGPVYSFS